MKVREILELLWCRGVDVGEENTNDVIKERVKTAQVSVALSSLAEEVGRLKEAELPTEWTGRDCIAYKYAIERVLKMMRGSDDKKSI